MTLMAFRLYPSFVDCFTDFKRKEIQSIGQGQGFTYALPPGTWEPWAGSSGSYTSVSEPAKWSNRIAMGMK